MSTLSPTLDFLLEKYGVALPFEDAASVLKYPSLIAARYARQRGTRGLDAISRRIDVHAP
jgi:hypothetical protein